MDKIFNMFVAKLVKTVFVLAVFNMYLFTSACSESSEETAANSNDGNFALQAPRKIRQAGFSPTRFNLTVMLDERELVLSLQEDDLWKTTETVPRGQSFNLSVKWSTNNGVTLATWDKAFSEVEKNLDISILDADYNYAYDDDGDGVSNIDEIDTLTTTDEIQYVGIIDVIDRPARADVYSEATFYKLPNQVPRSVIKDAFSFTEFLDRCFIGGFIGEFQSLNPTPVEAGEVLLLSSEGGTFMSLRKQETNGAIDYIGVTPGSHPGRLSLDIPGGEFPALSNVSIPTADSLVLTASINGEPITADTKITWVTGKDPSTIGLLSVFNRDANSRGLIANCWINDDGEFVLPADVQDEINGGPSNVEIAVVRVLFSDFRLDDSMLITVGNSIRFIKVLPKTSTDTQALMGTDPDTESY